ncbi:uncharacterized protein LOC116042204 isoform X2 [Sander lucioperca]|uniref:uncharacterized protein LOC116042204 isoform X2 n=1 Tax=Sander lucioperca TaxID=283035 RepID=UPI001653DE32|nr:uncharacterized protein LOC116042204 isoform X2 [Sander lucioperca]
MRLQVFLYDTFRRHARMFVEPAIVHTWRKSQEVMLHQLSQDNKVILGGDMRADSPGHCAKYGSYTMMDLNTNTIVDLQLVQSNEVGGSSYMEKEGLKRSLSLLGARGVTIDCIVTDRHPQIQKFLREENITQFYDVWHMEKGTPAFYNLEKELTKKTVLKDIAKLSPHYQTSSLEAFHSVILRFAPKNVVYPYLGMLCRLYLAALHYNENADRGQATTSSWDPRFKLSFPKSRKGECRARPVKTDATFRNFIFFLSLKHKHLHCT